MEFLPNLAAGPTQTCHGLEVVDFYPGLSRFYQGQQGKDGVLFQPWQPITGDCTLRNSYFCSVISVCVSV